MKATIRAAGIVLGLAFLWGSISRAYAQCDPSPGSVVEVIETEQEIFDDGYVLDWDSEIEITNPNADSLYTGSVPVNWMFTAPLEGGEVAPSVVGATVQFKKNAKNKFTPHDKGVTGDEPSVSVSEPEAGSVCVTVNFLSLRELPYGEAYIGNMHFWIVLEMSDGSTEKLGVTVCVRLGEFLEDEEEEIEEELPDEL